MRNAIQLLVMAICLGGATALAAENADEPITGRPLGAMTPQEQAERAAREACKIEICDILETREQLGPDISCDIGWTWHESEIADALGDKVDWPWGRLVCQSQIKLGRALLAEAMSAPRYKAMTETQTVRCSLYHNDGKPYVVELALAPEVTFKNGKAIKGTVNWGRVTAPSAIYALLYAATSLDNSTNILGEEVVRQVNKFTGEDCAKVKNKLPGRRVH